MNTTASVHFAKSAFWTIDCHAKTRAMSRYRSLWRGLDLQHQWKLECTVYAWRSKGIKEEVIGKIIEDTLNAARPWRLSNAKLIRVFHITQNVRRKQKCRRFDTVS